MNKVSCVTVTRNRVDLLKKCIEYFNYQTHEEKELIIVYYNTDIETKKFLDNNKDSLNEQNIFFHMFVEDIGLYLGAIRNYAIQKASGDWICIWDDDDWYSNDRIEKQLNFCLVNNLIATSLRSILIYSNKYQDLKLSFERSEGWEGSLFVKKEHIPRYRNLAKGEDTPVLLDLVYNHEYMTQFEPDLYVYIFHDQNISGNRHKQTILDNSYELDIKKQRTFKQKLDWI